MAKRRRRNPGKRGKQSGKSRFRLTAAQIKKLRTFTAMGFVFASVALFGYLVSQEIALRKTDLKTAPSKVSVKKPIRHFTAQPKLVFVIDDIGYHLNHEKILRALGNQVTYSILPMLPYSKYFANLSPQTGAEVILHLPLETLDGTIPGRGLITTQMPASQILETLNRNLASVPHHRGLNNHMGSLGTSDPVLMEIILKEIKRRQLFFLDSYTTPQSVIPDIGRNIGLPVLKRDVFLDNIDADQAIENQLKTLKSIARKRGYGIAIGHYRFNTLNTLRKNLPKLREEGFEILSLSELWEYLSQKR